MTIFSLTQWPVISSREEEVQVEEQCCVHSWDCLGLLDGGLGPFYWRPGFSLPLKPKVNNIDFFPGVNDVTSLAVSNAGFGFPVYIWQSELK